jgi:hypothetical protein
VKPFRTTFSLLICAAMLTLAACGGEDDTKTTAGSTPAASSAPAAPSAEPASSAAADTSGGGTSDKEICESVKKAGEDMKSSLVAAFQSGEEPSPAVFKKILTDLDKEVTSLAEAGGDSKVTAALKKFGTEAAKAAKAADPASAADNSAFEKAGADITAACKASGINVNF